MDTPNAADDLAVAMTYLQTFNANVIHELEAERIRIRSRDVRSRTKPRPASVVSDSSRTTPVDSDAPQPNISSFIASLLTTNTSSTPLAVVAACLDEDDPQSASSPPTPKSEPSDSFNFPFAETEIQTDVETVEDTSVPPELIRLMLSVVMLGLAMYSIPAAVGLLTIVGLVALRHHYLVNSGLGAESERRLTWREWLFGRSREQVWVQGKLAISEGEIISDLRCPISLSLFVDPVCHKPTGRVYERQHIHRHLSMSPCDPMSRLPAKHEDYIPSPIFKARAHEIAKHLHYVLADL